MTTRVFHVPDISCDHCKRAIEEALGELPEVTSAVVTVDRRDVEVEGAASDEADEPLNKEAERGHLLPEAEETREYGYDDRVDG